MSEADRKLMKEHLFLTVYAQLICIVSVSDEYATVVTNKIVDSLLEDTGETVEEITRRIINELSNE